MKDRFWRFRIAGTVALFSLAPGLAWSYIDAGNGAYVVQLLFTLAGAAAFYIRHPIRFLQAVRNLVFRRNSGDVDTVDAVPEEDPALKDSTAEMSSVGRE